MAAANSAKTAAAVEAARRALDAAVETASAAVETVEADSATLRTVEADVQTYQTEQTAILDGLQPITPASLATVKPAATLQIRITWTSGRRLTLFEYLQYRAAAERHNAAVAAAEKAMARARAERTSVRIDDARRAVRAIERSVIGVREAVDTALETTQTALTRARNYRTAQLPALAAILTPPETPPGSTLPGEVKGLSGIVHIEMTDFADAAGSLNSGLPSYDNVGENGEDVSPEDIYRRPVVCPGVPPRGNVCETLEGIEIDGTSYNPRFGVYLITDFGVEYHEAFLDDALDIPFDHPHAPAGTTFFGTQDSDYTDDGFGSPVAGLGRYSLAYTAWGPGDYTSGTHSGTGRGFYAAAMGQLHDGRPSGSAVWQGAVVGQELRGLLTTHVEGDIELNYNFAASTIDVVISELERIRASYDSSTQTVDKSSTSIDKRFEWRGLRVNNDASFYITGYDNDRRGTRLHPELGYIDGDFYGPNAEESAGVFERDYIIGGWLATRQTRAAIGDLGSGGSGSGGSRAERPVNVPVNTTAMTLTYQNWMAAPPSGALSDPHRPTAFPTFQITTDTGHVSVYPLSRRQNLIDRYVVSDNRNRHLSADGYASWWNRNGIETFIDSSAPSSSGERFDVTGGALSRSGFRLWGQSPRGYNTGTGAEFLRDVFGRGQYSAYLTDTHLACREGASLRASGGWSVTDMRYCEGSAFAAAFGSRFNARPPSNGTWRGAATADEIMSGAALVGDVTVTYSSSRNSVDIAITNLTQRPPFNDRTLANGLTYEGPSSFRWNSVSVDSNGGFFEGNTADTRDYVGGYFYGRQGQEATGVFAKQFSGGCRQRCNPDEDGAVVGGFVAKQ